VVVVPVAVTYCPPLQWVHDVQRSALLVVENVPWEQGAQVRSAVAVPAAATYWPALQSVHATQLAPGVVEKVPDAQGLAPWLSVQPTARALMSMSQTMDRELVAESLRARTTLDATRPAARAEPTVEVSLLE
jgi:hypothetical protein